MPKLITKRIKIIKPTSKSKPSAKYSVAAAAEECGILTYDPRKKTAKAKSRAAAAAVKAKKNTASSFLFEDEGGADYQDGLSRLRQLRFEMACRPSVGIHPSLIPPHTDIVSGSNNCGRMDMNQNNNIALPPSLSYHDAVALALRRGSPHIIDTTSGLSPSVGVTMAIQRGNNPRLINPKNRRENDENGSQSSSDIKNKKGERTAGNRVRHFLQHNYRDLASEPTVGTGVASLTCDSFPMILHKFLITKIISTSSHGSHTDEHLSLETGPSSSNSLRPNTSPGQRKWRVSNVNLISTALNVCHVVLIRERTIMKHF
jgi:hypothetical protein